MIIEISVAVIAIALVVWLSILSISAFKIRKLLEKSGKDIQTLVGEGSNLMRKIEELLSDIQSKSDSLDVLFRPFRKGKFVRETSDTISDLIELVSTGVSLFNKFRYAVKRRGK